MADTIAFFYVLTGIGALTVLILGIIVFSHLVAWPLAALLRKLGKKHDEKWFDKHNK